MCQRGDRLGRVGRRKVSIRDTPCFKEKRVKRRGEKERETIHRWFEYLQIHYFIIVGVPKRTLKESLNESVSSDTMSERVFGALPFLSCLLLFL